MIGFNYLTLTPWIPSFLKPVSGELLLHITTSKRLPPKLFATYPTISSATSSSIPSPVQDGILSTVEVVNLTSGEVTLGPELPAVGSSGCSVVHEGYVYLVRAYGGAKVFHTSEVYRATGELLGHSLRIGHCILNHKPVAPSCMG